MGIVSSLLKRRLKNKAAVKAAQSRAVSEVKQGAKLKWRQEKLLAKERKYLEKSHRKNLKTKNKHEKKLAEATYRQLKAGSFNAQTVRRYTGAARLLVPVVLPLIYKGVTMAREQLVKKQAAQHGVTADKLAQFSGYGAPLKARISSLRETVKNSPLPSGFKRDVDNRLDQLDAAVDNADYMGANQRQRIHNTIDDDLQTITGDIHTKLRKEAR